MANYKYFKHENCEFYPCHNTEKLNCLFCFCPLYFKDCGGDFCFTDKGIKDCSNCLIPHTDVGYDFIISKLKEKV